MKTDQVVVPQPDVHRQDTHQNIDYVLIFQLRVVLFLFTFELEFPASV